jgi:transposase
MTIGHVNVEETIERIKNEISKDKSISPILISSIELLIVVIQMLFDRQLMNSSNSSLPPASDMKGRSRDKDKKKRKKKGENNIGGQSGHLGATLTQYEEVDETIELSIDLRTLPVGIKFTSCKPETRQVIDLNLEFIVREYQAEVLLGDDGTRFVATFPEHITKAIRPIGKIFCSLYVPVSINSLC